MLNADEPVQKPRRRRRGTGCALGCLTTLIVLALLLAAGWVFALRPYLNTMALTELDHAMTTAVDQIPAQASQLPSGTSLPVADSTINTLIVANLAPSNPVKQPQTLITTQHISLSFQLYGYANTITAVPTVTNNHLTMTNVNISGPIGFVVSSDDIASLLNRHLADAQTRIQHSITNVQLKDHEMVLLVS